MSSNSTVGALMGLGNPLLDMMSTCNKDLLDKFELKEANAILAEEKHLPLYDEIENPPYKVEYVAGGATQNSIRVAQWFLEANSTSFIGSVGQDTHGESMANAAKADGVNVLYQLDSKNPTGTCAVLVVDKERSMVANLAAANTYDVAHLSTPEISAAVDKATLFYISGFFLTVSPEAIMHVAKHAHEKDKTVCMNLSAPFICQFFKDPLMAAMPFVDYIFGNETEALAFAESQGFEEKTIPEIAQRIANLPKEKDSKPRKCVITQGADATVIATQGESAPVLFPTPALAKELIVDTNGAGDSFVGGFLSGLLHGKVIDECVARGNYAARHVIQESGAKVPKKAVDFVYTPTNSNAAEEGQ